MAPTPEEDDAFEAHLQHRLAKRHASTRFFSEESALVGMIGERVLANHFGLEPQWAKMKAGDSGIDLWLLLECPNGRQWVAADAKASKRGETLYTPADTTRRRTIYVWCLANPQTRQGVLMGWEWGRTMLKHPKRRAIPSVPRLFHCKDMPMRQIEEIDARFIRAAHPKPGSPLEPPTME